MAKSMKSEIPLSVLDEIEDADKADDAEVEVQMYTMLDLFRHKNLALISLNIGSAFIANTLVYYGLSFNVDSLAGSVYVNNVVNGFVELLAYIVVMATLDKYGKGVNLQALKSKIIIYLSRKILAELVFGSCNLDGLLI